MGSFTVTGLREAIADTFRFGRMVGPVNMLILRNGAVEIVAGAVQDCPIDTGRLQSSIDIYEEGDNFVILGAGGMNGELAGYAGFVEEGTSKMLPQPYMRPNVERFKATAGGKFRLGFERMVL